MLGVLETADAKMTMGFENAGDLIYLLGTPEDDINCSEYANEICGIKNSVVPHFDLEEEAKLQHCVSQLIHKRLIQSAHDVSEGGLFVTLLESAMDGGRGFECATDENYRKDAYLFGESQSRVVVSVHPDTKEKFELILSALGVEHAKIGYVLHETIIIDKQSYGAVQEWKDLYDNAISKKLGVEAELA